MNYNEVLELKAPAKVNLTLHVVGKRADGYHELETWMQKVSLFDFVTLQLKKDVGIHLECDNPEVPSDNSNLVWMAAEAVLEKSGLTDSVGVSIKLEKNIPVAAGLGGGSSDCAAVLRGINDLLDKPLSHQELLDLGLSLGADVPFFVSEYDAVLAKGVGEKMVAIPSLTGLTFVLVNPGVSVSTKWVFENLVLTENKEKSTFSPFSSAESLLPSLDCLFNDLEKVTEKRYPVIGEIKEYLKECGAEHVLMSGSGSTVFGLFRDKSNKNSCIEVEDVVNRMRLRFGNKAYIVRTSTGA